MQWLSPPDPRRRYHDVRTDRLDGVGNWILETKEFQEWSGTRGGVDKAILFYYRDLGVRKTYLSSLVIDNLYDEPCKEEIAIAMFYSNLHDQQEQATPNIIGAILKQLVVRGEVLEYVQTAFHKAKREVGGQGLRLPGMAQMLKQAIAILPQVNSRYSSGSLRTRVFLPGRLQVEAEITKYFITRSTISVIPKTHDIEIYLENKLETDPEPVAMFNDLRADILRIIPERISEIFLLVSLITDAILGSVLKRPVRLLKLI